MRELQFISVVTEYEGLHELPDADRRLMEQALEARSKAYAPYSHFYVGAAVLLDDGTVVQGNNQENVAYPSGLCAERTALFAAAANNPGKRVTAIAISAYSDDFEVNTPVYPCGACRQVMSEYERLGNGKIRIIMMGASGTVQVVDGLINLLPAIFEADKLRRK